jgi:hypothetical protein
MRTLEQSITLVAAALTIAACDDSTGPGFGGAPDATLSFAVVQPTAGSIATQPTYLGMGPQAVVITDGAGRTLDITQIQVVLEDVELDRQFDDDCNDVDACEKFEIGPVLIDLPVEGGIVTPFNTQIPADVYDELEVEIDDAEDDSTSAQFFAANPSWPREASMRIVGTFDANDGAGPQPFDVYLEISAEIERELNPPLVVTDSTNQDVNVTVQIDVAAWFNDGSGLVDPRDLATNDDLVDDMEDRIEESFEAFEDDDRDGDDDDDDDDSDDDDLDGDDDGTDDQGSGDN